MRQPHHFRNTPWVQSILPIAFRGSCEATPPLLIRAAADSLLIPAGRRNFDFAENILR